MSITIPSIVKCHDHSFSNLPLCLSVFTHLNTQAGAWLPKTASAASLLHTLQLWKLLLELKKGLRYFTNSIHRLIIVFCLLLYPFGVVWHNLGSQLVLQQRYMYLGEFSLIIGSILAYFMSHFGSDETRIAHVLVLKIYWAIWAWGGYPISQWVIAHLTSSWACF